MSILETLKEVAGAAIDAVVENPIVAVVTVGVVASGVGGTVWYRRRKAKKTVNVKDTLKHLEEVAAAGNAALAAAHAELAKQDQAAA